VRQIGDRNTFELIKNDGAACIDKSVAIAAGKFRRYHGVSWVKQVLDIPMQLKNIRDGAFFLLGLIQSFVMFVLSRPDVVFVKGGYVGLPVGLAAVVLRIPLVVHESDTHMGLTNSILSKHARAVGVGMPKSNYQLENTEVSFVGVPVSSDYKYVDEALQAQYKKQLGIDTSKQVVVVTGGSHGAERVNNIVSAIAAKLADRAYILHQTGKETFEATKAALEANLSPEQLDNYRVQAFVGSDMHVFLGAGDVVVTRVGVTTISELAISAKPLVLIPNPKLVYGHQLLNAKAYQEENAALVVDESEATDDPELLYQAVVDLLDSEDKRKELAANLHKLAKPDASTDIAKLILKQI